MQGIRHVHFVGIGGSGMSGIAGIMHGLGFRVSGSDLALSAATERLAAMGITCYAGHDEDHLGEAEMVVASTAIPPGNVELLAAKRRGIPIVHRGEMLAWLMQRQKGIAISGAHGKTTTTSMMALVLESSGLEPTIVIGGDLTEIGGNARLGMGDYMVAEADESDGSFLKLDPFIEVITNIEDDHLDYYNSFENIVKAFREFMAKVPADGLAIVCLDDPTIRDLLATYHRPYQTYALDRSEADYTMKDILLEGNLSAGSVFCRDNYLGRLELTVPGRHNLSNALAVVAVGCFIGLSFDEIASALNKFRGAGRRFQVMGDVHGIRVVDDYAHHPSEIKATLRAAKQFRAGRVIAVFQPHRFTRTALIGEQFGSAFADADMILISDIYSAGETPIAGVSGRTIVSAVEMIEGREVIYLPTKKEIIDYLVKKALPGDLILTMGAGDIWQAGVELVERLKGSRKID